MKFSKGDVQSNALVIEELNPSQKLGYRSTGTAL